MGTIRDNAALKEPAHVLQRIASALIATSVTSTVALAQSQPSMAATETTQSTSSDWRARLTYHFIFPSVILANATRPQPANRSPHVLGDFYGPVSIDVKSDKPNTPVVLMIAIDGIAQLTESKYILPEPGSYTLRPRLNWQYSRLQAQTMPAPTNMMISATIDGVAVGSKHGAVRVLSVNDVPTLIHTSSGNVTFAWMFAAFVNEEHPWIDPLLHEAIVAHRVNHFVGYQGGPAEVNRQVRAIYDTLHQRGVVYSSVTTNSSPDPRVYSQHVRFLSDSVRNSQANCIDGVVLMASILRKIGIDAFIVTGPGHAILGYRADRNIPRQITFVETTMIANAPFAKAVAAGNAKFDEWRSKNPPDPHFHVVDIAKERADGVMPIAR